VICLCSRHHIFLILAESSRFLQRIPEHEEPFRYLFVGFNAITISCVDVARAAFVGCVDIAAGPEVAKQHPPAAVHVRYFRFDLAGQGLG